MRKVLENEFVKLVFDSEVMNVTELINKSTGDNYVKTLQKDSIISLWCLGADGVKEKFTPARATDLKMEQCADGPVVSVIFDGFTSGGKKIDAVAGITIRFSGERMLKWDAVLENRDHDYDIVEVLFPHIRGIYLGGSWKDDIIIYPHHAGEKTLNPVQEYTGERYLNFWRAESRLNDDVYSREINYCGLASMTWLYYYDKNNGLYFGSNDSRFPLTGILAETGGPENPWMGFGFRKYTRIRRGSKWFSEPYTIGISCEDWHWGAKEYRKWVNPYIKVDNNPEFLQNEYALNQCYNFKKDGSIHNRFDRIPALFDEGKKYGVRHMFIASWNRKGFDCNYPEYYPDMELGTAMDLYNGCRYVNENGGFVTFYINARLFDMKSDFYPTLGQDMAIKNENGELSTEVYGPVGFAVMCPADAKWQKHLVDTACWMVRSYGATGMYLDQLGSAEPFPCYDKNHSHDDPGDFNKGYLAIVKNLREKLDEIKPGTFLMIENCGDIYGSYVWGSLTWNGDPYDEYFNVFKYTFPEFMQINMVNPRSEMAGSSERDDTFYRHMERAMLLGSVFWLGITYKFREGDEELWEYAVKALQFRKKINPMLSTGKYEDNIGITCEKPGISSSRWKLEDGSELIIAGNMKRESGCRLGIETARPSAVIAEDIDGNGYAPEFEYRGNVLEVVLPAGRMVYLHIKH